MGMIKLKIDGKEIEAREGKTILEIARENGIFIPTLCYHKNLFPIGSCRVCIVEIDGYEKPMISCDTVAQDGISVTTQSEKLFKMRQEYVKFLLIHHPLECPICDSAGECTLQDLAFGHKIESVDLAAEKEPRTAGVYSTALIKYVESRCVLCLRCVHACREVSGRTVLALEGSGIEAKMAPVNHDDCISCGECLYMCPVGALCERISPIKSRFWQTRRQETTCPHCGFGCSFTMDVYEDRVITKVLTDADKLPNRGSLCVMGRFGYDFANHESVLKTPALKEGGTMRPATLEEAVDATAAALAKLGKEGKGTGFIVSPRATNEEIALLSQIAATLPSATMATTGFSHTGKALPALEEAGIPLVYDYDEMLGCDLVITAGADLLANNHLLGNKVREAVKKGGAKVAVIDPSPAPLTRIADVWLKVAPKTDGFLFKSLAGKLIADKKHDPDVEKLTGFAEYSGSLGAQRKEAAIEQCGIDGKGFDKFYNLFSKANKVAVVIGSGITASEESLASLLNLCLLKGIGKKAVIMATALQSNAMGALSIMNGAVSPDQVLSDPAIEGLLIYEDDPFHYLNESTADKAFKAKSFVAVCDAFSTRTFDYAHVSAPTGTYADKAGTCVAEDGFTRKAERAWGSTSPGFQFLRMLLDKLSGTLYKHEDELRAVLHKNGSLVYDGAGREAVVAARRGEMQFLKSGQSVEAAPTRPYTLVLRNAFFHHHLSGKENYSKMVHLTNPSVAGDKLFISPEDAALLAIADGDAVTLESDFGSVQGKAIIKAGLRKGVVEYRLLRKRQDILKLAPQSYGKHIAVTLKKG
jgi:predicted molibdopterin-dependent oxidoreductase YjgC